MRLTYKYRLYPTKDQVSILEDQLREACDLYNCALQERIGAWEICRKSISFYDQDKQLKPMRAEGLVGIVSFSCARDVLRRVDRAFRNFFRRAKNGDKPGFPRYRSFRRYDSLTFPEPGHGYRLLEIGVLRLQGLGHLKLKIHRPIEGIIKTLTIKREAGRWFVCFSVDRRSAPLPPSNRSVGIDVGLKSFATLSDGSEVHNPRHYWNAQAKLRRVQRKVSRRKKGGNRRRKAVLQLQRAHVHVRNQRADFQHKLSRDLVNQYGLIAVEDLNVKGLASGMLAKSVRDAGWSQFINFLSYKAECAGRVLMKVDPRGTSQTCLCGERVPKTLSDRWHRCPACGLSASRDHVSAQVILQRAGNRPSGANVEVVNSCVA